MKTILTVTTAALMLTAGAVLAQVPELPWTLTDFEEVYPDVAPEVFIQLDANADGLLDQIELDAGIAAGLIAPIEG